MGRTHTTVFSCMKMATDFGFDSQNPRISIGLVFRKCVPCCSDRGLPFVISTKRHTTRPFRHLHRLSRALFVHEHLFLFFPSLSSLRKIFRTQTARESNERSPAALPINDVVFRSFDRTPRAPDRGSNSPRPN